MTDDMETRFTYHPPTGDQPDRYASVRGSARAFADIIADTAPESRERAIALERVEEAVMWANTAIARHTK